MQRDELAFKLTNLPEPLLYGLYHALLAAAGKWYLAPHEMSEENTEHCREFFSILQERYGLKEGIENSEGIKSVELLQQPDKEER